MDFFGNTLSRTQKQLCRLLLCACLLALRIGRSDAQVATSDASTTSSANQPSAMDMQTFCSLSSSAGNPACANLRSTTVDSQGQIDISSPRPQVRPQVIIAPQPAPPPTPSEFQQVVADSTGRMLPIFGTGLFNSTPSTFAPVDNIPVTPDYVIGPGDEIQLQVWGQVSQRGTFVVDRTGSISLPEVGTLHVAGLQYSQLSDFLKAQMGRVYRNFDLNVNLGQLRSIQVFVVGQARQPGNYTIGSLSTLLNALFASGGPLPQGSLRDIQVKRDGATITHFDLYDLLLNGDKTKDIRLVSGDVIFIPDVGPQVAVVGSVTTPAIYELRDEKTFSQVIAMAGGLTSVAAGTQVRVDRIDNHTQRSVIDVDLTAANPAPVKDGDIVTVNSIVGRFQNAVTLRGNVANPGRYTWHEGMRISDLIPSREALVTRDYYQRLMKLGQSNSGSVAGSSSNDYTQSPTGAPGSQGSLTVQSPPSDTANGRGTATASGGGNSVGAALTEADSKFAPRTDVVLNAPDIDWEYAVIERQSPTDLTSSLLPFNLGKAVIDKDPAQDLTLLPGDVVSIFSKADIRVPSSQQTRFVKLEGEFAAAGVYSVLPGENLHQLLMRAGGLAPGADLYASEFTRETVRLLQRQRLSEYADELESQITATTAANSSTAVTDRDATAAVAAASTARAAVARLRQAQPSGRVVLPLKPDSQGIDAIPDISLEDGDRFVVPRIPATVSVQGQVYNANAFLYLKGRRVKDYLRLAGGPDRVGDRNREFILRADGSVVSRQENHFAERAVFADRGFDEVLVYPGDTIIVPPIIQKTAFLRNLADIGTIFEGFGLGAAAIEVLK